MGVTDVVHQGFVHMPDAALLMGYPKSIKARRFHTFLYVRYINRILVKDEANISLSVLELFVIGERGGLGPLRKHLINLEIPEHLVRVSRMRPLAEHLQVVATGIHRQVRKNVVVVIVS